MKRSILLAALFISAGAPALAADLPVKARPAPVAVVEVWNWTGFYIGANGGYSWGRSRTDVGYFNPVTGAPIVPPAGSITSADFKLNGGIAGGQVGYNWQSGSFVFGFEADLQWSGERGSASYLCAPAAFIGGACLPGLTFLPPGVTGTTLTVDQQIEWFGTLRGRAGLLVTPSFLAYVTGGLAYGSVKTGGTLGSFTPNGLPAAAVFSSKTTHAGWVIGGGIEAHLGGNWTGKAEYLYMDLGTFDSTVALVAPAIGANISSRVTDNIFRVGINYHFTPGPVVARY